MKAKHALMIAVAAVVASGCAGRASSVEPVAIAATDYSTMPCDAARGQLVVVRDRVNTLSRQQNNASLADTAGVALLLLPLGSIFGGDKSGDLAQAKGEQLALERHIQMRCS